MQIAFATYGHTRTPDLAHVPRNSVIATNYCSLLGVRQVAEVVDYSPPVGAGGIDWSAVGSMHERIEPADALYCQAACSLQVMQRWREIAGDAPIILQRDSTHARKHRALMVEAMNRHGIAWPDHYDLNPHNVDRECAEYDLADHIFVLSRWVKSTFDEHGLAHKVVQFAPQMADASRWRPVDYHTKPSTFTAICPGQLGLRKGTFDLLEAWARFWPQHPDSQLILAGLPEHGAPPEVGDKLRAMVANTPRVKMVGWIEPDRMCDAYANAHVLVMPSWEDGGTCTGPEAALCGLPIIATRNAGIDVLHDGTTGWEVPYGSVHSLENALCEAAADRTRLAWYSRTILQAAQADCSMERYSRGVAESLTRVLGR